MASNKRLNWFRKTTEPWDNASLLAPASQSSPWGTTSPIRFKNVNERASVDQSEAGSAVFCFRYVNDFYGSCEFVAGVIEQENLPLRLDEDSISLETYHIKKGSLPILLNISKLFLRRMLGKLSSVNQLQTNP